MKSLTMFFKIALAFSFFSFLYEKSYAYIGANIEECSVKYGKSKFNDTEGGRNVTGFLVEKGTLKNVVILVELGKKGTVEKIQYRNISNEKFNDEQIFAIFYLNTHDIDNQFIKVEAPSVKKQKTWMRKDSSAYVVSDEKISNIQVFTLGGALDLIKDMSDKINKNK